METADVLVIGLGPAGASAAAEAARRGCKVVALDRKREAGLPVQCAELVPALLDVEAGAVRQRVASMVTFVEDDAPDLKPDFPGRMLDRAAFDRSLVDEAARAGGDIRFSCFITKITPKGLVELADGTTITRGVSRCTFEIAGISETSPVVLGGPRDAPLLGMVTLETLGLMLNPLTRELLPMKLMLAALAPRAA